MPRDFATALEEERQAIVSALAAVPDAPEVELLTELQSLSDFAEEFEALWETRGEDEAVEAAAEHAFDYYLTVYVREVLNAYGSDILDYLRKVEIDVAWAVRHMDVFSALVGGRHLDARPAATWLLEEGLPQATDLRESLLIWDTRELGKWVRLVEERVATLALNSRNDDEDDWVYDNLEVLHSELRRRDLVVGGLDASLAAHLAEDVLARARAGHSERRIVTNDWPGQGPWEPEPTAPTPGSDKLAPAA